MRKVIVLFVLVLINSCANSNEELNVQSESTLLKENQEFKESSKGSAEQVIFTLEDFERLAMDESSVVSKLSNKTLTDFINSMEFRSEDGFITTAKYTIIENELSPEDNESFWLLLGMNKMAYTDYKEYYCESSHNCKKLRDYICLTGC